MQAANYLNIKALLDLGCLTVANMIKGALLGPNATRQSNMLHKISSGGLTASAPCTGKTPEEIRKTFNIAVRLLDCGLPATSAWLS
jgi:hypothetical protein